MHSHMNTSKAGNPDQVASETLTQFLDGLVKAYGAVFAYKFISDIQLGSKDAAHLVDTQGSFKGKNREQSLDTAQALIDGVYAFKQDFARFGVALDASITAEVDRLRDLKAKEDIDRRAAAVRRAADALLKLLPASKV